MPTIAHFRTRWGNRRPTSMRAALQKKLLSRHRGDARTASRKAGEIRTLPRAPRRACAPPTAQRPPFPVCITRVATARGSIVSCSVACISLRELLTDLGPHQSVNNLRVSGQ